MISSLSLAGLGVIDGAELDLGRGLTVLTGETGAGKTMVVTSLQLLVGGRASADVVRADSDRARVTAHVEVPAGGEVADRVREAGGDLDGGTLTLLRSVNAAGRSRAAVGGAGVPVGLLAEVGTELVTIHGQHDQGRLTTPSHQRDLLDRYGDLAELAAAVATAFVELRDLTSERARLLAERQERLREADLLRFGLREIEAVAPEEGEDEALTVIEQRLSHAVDLAQAAWAVAGALGEDEQALTSRIAELQRTLDGVRAFDPRLDDLAGRLTDVGYLVSDLASELVAYGVDLEADPGRLAEVQERRAALTGLQRKYGPGLDDVLAWATEASSRLAGLDGTDDRLAELDDLIDRAERRWREAAADLSAAREAAAGVLADRVTAELAALAMPDAALVVEVAPRLAKAGLGGDARTVALPDGRLVVASPTGMDEVSFLLRPHRGGTTLPVQRGASGGELSRVMLAIEVVLADADPVPTVVFDEVDAGVGGAAAVEVGRRLAMLGRSRQVLVVTHLPQVAAFADHHWLVSKSTSGEITSSDVCELDEQSRVKELTRMLSGLSESVSGRAHAEELLAVARAQPR